MQCSLQSIDGARERSNLYNVNHQKGDIGFTYSPPGMLSLFVGTSVALSKVINVSFMSYNLKDPQLSAMQDLFQLSNENFIKSGAQLVQCPSTTATELYCREKRSRGFRRGMLFLSTIVFDLKPVDRHFGCTWRRPHTQHPCAGRCHNK